MRQKTARWFEVRAKVAKMQEDGTTKPVSEQYVVDAMTFTEAESKITEYLSGYYTEFEVTTEKIARFREVYLGDDNTSVDWNYFKVTIETITLDEQTGKEKHARGQILVEAQSTAKAEALVHSVVMKDMMLEYKIVDISETKFMDVIEHN